MSTEFRPGYLANFKITKRLTQLMKAQGKVSPSLKSSASVSVEDLENATARALTIFTAAMIADGLGYTLEVHLKRKGANRGHFKKKGTV